MLYRLIEPTDPIIHVYRSSNFLSYEIRSTEAHVHLCYYTCAIYGVTIAPTRAAAVWKPSANALTLVGYTSGVYT